jgi:prophage tail gpP-like protein
MDQPTKVSLIVEGMEYTAFERITVQYAANQAARAFAVTVSDANDGWDLRWNFMPGAEVTIFANGQLVFTGYIDKMTPSFDSKNHTVEVSGRSKSKDTIDSSTDHKTNEFKKKTTLQIAQELDYTGAGFRTDIEQPTLEYFRVNPNETIFNAVERAARRHQMLLQGMEDGSVKLTKGGTGGVNQALVEGVNILAGSATFDESDVHSEYKVRGQRVFGTDKKALQIVGKATNSGMRRTRKKHIHQESDIDEPTAKKRAEHHKNKQQGESITANIKVQSWFDSNGEVWKANALVYVYSPMLKLDQQMLIKSVSLQQSGSGSITDLTLALPQSFGGEGTSMGGSGKTGSGTQKPWE